MKTKGQWTGWQLNFDKSRMRVIQFVNSEASENNSNVRGRRSRVVIKASLPEEFAADVGPELLHDVEGGVETDLLAPFIGSVAE
jgi:hypothetical protein